MRIDSTNSREGPIHVAVGGGSCRINMRVRTVSEHLVAFIHGLGCSMEFFNDVWDSSDWAEYSVLCFDLPGFGESPAPVRISYSMEEHAAVAGAVIRQYMKGTVSVVGHSMGGAIGLLLPGDVRARFSAFACIEGNLVGEDCTASRVAARVSLSDFEKHIFPRLKAEASPRWASAMRKTSPKAFYHSARSLVEWSDSERLLERFLGLNCRKAYFYGDRNRDMPVLRRIAAVEKIEIADAGHFLMTEQPARFYPALRSFVRGRTDRVGNEPKGQVDG